MVHATRLTSACLVAAFAWSCSGADDDGTSSPAAAGAAGTVATGGAATGGATTGGVATGGTATGGAATGGVATGGAGGDSAGSAGTLAGGAAGVPIAGSAGVAGTEAAGGAAGTSSAAAGAGAGGSSDAPDRYEQDDDRVHAYAELGVPLDESDRNFVDDAEDWIVFPGEGNARYTVTVRGLGANVRPKLEVYDEISVTPVAYHDNPSGTQTTVAAEVPLDMAGNLFVRVSDSGGVSGAETGYELLITRDVSGASDYYEWLDRGAAGNNDDLSHAEPVDADQANHFRFTNRAGDTPVDRDCVGLWLSPDTNYQVTATGAASDFFLYDDVAASRDAYVGLGSSTTPLQFTSASASIETFVCFETSLALPLLDFAEYVFRVDTRP
jgi:hypothetical protein